VEKETRRKIWWGVYTLDRMLALALGRPLGINDSDCDVELPVDVDDQHLPEYFSGAPMTQSQPSLMMGSIALIKLYEIGGRVLRQVYALENCKDHLEPERKAELQRTVESLDTELTKWCDELPVVFKSPSETGEQVSMGAVLCSHYYSVLTTLHRNLLPVKSDQPVTAKSTVKAVSSARSCIRLAPSMKHVVPPSHHLAFFIQHLFSSAVIVLLYAMHASEQRAATTAMDEAKSTLVALESWEGQWPGAKKCKELLIDLINTATEAITQGAREKSSAGTIPTQPSNPSSPTTHERRRSVTIGTVTTVTTGPAPGRVVKGRPRRNQSRDQSTSSRRLAAVSPYRVDAGMSLSLDYESSFRSASDIFLGQRARSTSRKRGHDDAEGLERTNATPFYQSFSSPNAGARAGSSTHSSPASVNLPSPSMPSIVDEAPPQDPNPLLIPPNTYTFTPQPSLGQLTSPHRYEYEFGVPPSALSQSNVQQWNVEQQTPDQTLFGNPFGPYASPLDNYGGYDLTTDFSGGLTGLSTTPPSSSTFATSGLPFRGLDFIRNYNPSGFVTGDQDSLWQSYDPGAFGYDPELPFTLGDTFNDLPDGIH